MLHLKTMQFGVCGHCFYSRVHTAAYYVVIHRGVRFGLEEAVTRTEQHGSLGMAQTCSLLTTVSGAATKPIAE